MDRLCMIFLWKKSIHHPRTGRGGRNSFPNGMILVELLVCPLGKRKCDFDLNFRFKNLFIFYNLNSVGLLASNVRCSAAHRALGHRLQPPVNAPLMKCVTTICLDDRLVLQLLVANWAFVFHVHAYVAILHNRALRLRREVDVIIRHVVVAVANAVPALASVAFARCAGALCNTSTAQVRKCAHTTCAWAQWPTGSLQHVIVHSAIPLVVGRVNPCIEIAPNSGPQGGFASHQHGTGLGLRLLKVK